MPALYLVSEVLKMFHQEDVKKDGQSQVGVEKVSFLEQNPMLKLIASIASVFAFLAILALVNGVVLAFELLPLMLMITGKW